MSIPFVDTYSTKAYGHYDPAMSWTHTVGNYSNRMMLIGVMHDLSPGSDISGVTVDGSAATFLVKQASSAGGYMLEVWYKTAPTVGASTAIVVTPASAFNACGGAITCYDADQSGTPFTGSNSSQNGSSSIQIVGVASSDTDLGISFVGISGSDGSDPGASQTEIFDLVGSYTIAASSKAGSAGGLTMSITGLSSYYNMLIVASLKYAPPPSGGGFLNRNYWWGNY